MTTDPDALRAGTVAFKEAANAQNATDEGVVMATIEAYNAALPPAAGEPVAWRFRSKGATLWIYDPNPVWLESQDDSFEKEPLYPHPAPPAPDAVREAVAAAWQWRAQYEDGTWFKWQSGQNNPALFRNYEQRALYTHPAPPAVADDYRTHHNDWRKACTIARDQSSDDADRSYWRHQIDTLDKISSTPPPDAVREAVIAEREATVHALQDLRPKENPVEWSLWETHRDKALSEGILAIRARLAP